jgi:ABC-2 type transport system ATP-binding protein
MSELTDTTRAADEVIGLEGLCKQFGATQVLRDVSLSIGPGVTGLLGPNGAGKSTLIKILLGLLRSNRGSGHVLGFSVGAQSRAIREQVGFMPEDDCYLPGLSGVECVQFSARMCRLPGIEALRRAHEILDFCGAGQERYRQAETYSTGMRQKLKFAQALVHDPPLLILDEPTSGLDPEERDAMLNRIRVLASREHKSVVLCTHILQDVQAVSDAVVILGEGRVRVADRLETLMRRESPAVHVRTIGSSDALQAALQRQGLTVSEGYDGQLSAMGAGDANVERVWAAVRESGTLIKSLTPAQNSMEAIFMAAVRGDTHGDS